MGKVVSFSFMAHRFKVKVDDVGFWRRGIGLMFRSKNTNNLIFEFSREGLFSITSYFVFFPFVAIWLDGQNHVVDVALIRPFRLSVRPLRRYQRLIEVPVNAKNREILRFLDGKIRKV